MELEQDVDLMVSRATMFALMRAAREARPMLPHPAYFVITEAGLTIAHDSEQATRLARTFAGQVGIPSLVAQLVSVHLPNKEEPAPAPAEEGGE